MVTVNITYLQLGRSASLVSTADYCCINLSVTQFDQMSCGESPKEFRPPSHSEKKKLKTSEEVYILGDDQSNTSTTLYDEDIQALAVHPQDLRKLLMPRPPKDCQKPVLMARGCKTQTTDEVRNAARGAVAQSLNLDPNFEPLDYPGLRFDDQGMILPHSVLGSLEDFRSYLKAKGKTELVKRIPKLDSPLETPGRHRSEAVEKERGHHSGYRNIQGNALQHWHNHMTQRRQQQGFLSDLLDRPVENLLMNQANCFRETQEKREFLNRAMPLIHSGYGYRVGSEFWSLPPRYGDEMSGIRATLTQAEQGRWEPVTHVTQPSSIRQESGIICAETLRPASRTWDQSAYLQQQCQRLGEVLQDMDIKKLDFDRLEVIGSGKPSTFVTVCHSPSLERADEQKENEEMKKEKLNSLAQNDNVWSDALPVPALRFCGQLASWTGNFTANQGEVGVTATIIFEALAGEIASSHLELHNEGSTAIFYSWQQLLMPRTLAFANLQSQTKSPCFYFDSSSGVLLPGDTKRVEVIFKSAKAGIKKELWQLSTHPVLLQGASMQVTLRGIALYQDKTADQRLFLQRKLKKIVTVKMCRSIVYELLQGVRTPPSSPAELYITEEQEFLSKNPKLYYLDQPVEDLKRLWQDVNPGQTWDLSVHTLRQVVMSLPEHDSAQEKSLAQLNSVLLQLCEPSELKHHPTAAAIGQQLWRKLLDTMVIEAVWLRDLLGLPESETWIEKKEESNISDSDMADKKDEKSEKKGGAAARSGAKSRLKDANKGETTEESVEDNRRRGKRRDDAGKRSRKKQGKESALLTDTGPEIAGQQPPIDQNVEPVVMDTYTRLLHKKVYALMGELVDNLCDLMDELHEGHE